VSLAARWLPTEDHVKRLSGQQPIYLDLFSALGGTRIPNLLIRSSARGIFPPTPVMTIRYQ
jgi:hypothetical protein